MLRVQITPPACVDWGEGCAVGTLARWRGGGVCTHGG